MPNVSGTASPVTATTAGAATAAVSSAFPAISCGVYAYPLDEAAELAVATVREHHGALKEVRFVLFGAKTLAAWKRACS